MSDLEEELGPEEDVEESEEEEGGESGHEGAAKIEVLACDEVNRGVFDNDYELTIWSKQGSSSEASKDSRSDHEGGGHQGGVHHDGHLQQGAQTKSSQECKAEQHAHAHCTVLAIVRSHEQAQCKSSSKEREQDAAPLEEGGEQVHVGPGRGGQHGHGEAGVHVLQVRADIPVAGENSL